MRLFGLGASFLLLFATPSLGGDRYHGKRDKFSREQYPKDPDFDLQESEYNLHFVPVYLSIMNE